MQEGTLDSLWVCYYSTNHTLYISQSHIGAVPFVKVCLEWAGFVRPVVLRVVAFLNG